MTFWEWLTARFPALKPPRGQGLVEYALILVLVAVVVIAILAILGPAIADVYDNVLARF